MSAVHFLSYPVAWDTGIVHFTIDKTEAESLNDVLEHGRVRVRLLAGQTP